MPIDIFYFLSCVLFPLFVLFFFNFLRHKQQSNNHKRKLPPGEMGFPFIGETMKFFDAQRRNKLYEEFVHPRITKHGKIFKTRIIGSPTVIVNGAEANKFLLSNEFKLVKSSWPASSVHLMGKDSIMEKDGERHRSLRGVIATSLGYAGLERLVPNLCNFVQLYLSKNWRGRDEISLYRSTKVLTFNIVFECLLGINVEPGMVDTFERVLEGVFSMGIRFPGSKFWRAMKAREEIGKMIMKVVREKRKEIEEGKLKRVEDRMLMSKLVYGMIQGEITEKEIIDNVVLLVFAAHDTTSFAVAMTFKMLAQHHDCYGKVLQEHVDIMRNKRCGESLNVDDIKKMKYTWQVARESMRLFPPIFGSFRKAITDIEYEGFTIPKGWKMLWTTYGTHYNEEYFKDPMSFNPSRFEEGMPQYAYVPFGGGPRVCVGYQLAKLNILILVYYVVTQYDWFLIDPNETVSMDPLPFPSLGMPIRISPKHV